MNFDSNNFILEEFRKVREKAEKKFIRWHWIPLIGSYFKRKALIAKNQHQRQFLRTREIYQQSDEHKKTRGY